MSINKVLGENCMKKAYILRGLPGGGKSTVAEALASTEKSSVIHSTDNYCMVGKKYVFNRDMLGIYHQKNLEAFEESCKKGVKVVICDNTNIKKGYYSKYTRAAKKYGYSVFVLTAGDFNVSACYRRNSHNVPRNVIRDMKKEFVL